MTLTLQDRTRTLGLIGPRRSDWDHAGIEAALVETSRLHPNDDLLVVALAVAAARDAKALTPAAMHTRGVDGRVVPAVTPRPTPRATDPECGVCGSQIRRADGGCHGCHLDGAFDQPRPASPASKPYRTVAPPPADFWAQVEANKPVARIPDATNGENK